MAFNLWNVLYVYWVYWQNITLKGISLWRVYSKQFFVMNTQERCVVHMSQIKANRRCLNLDILSGTHKPVVGFL